MTVTHSGILTSTEYANAPAMLETSEGMALQIGPAMRPKDTPTQKLNPTGLCACGCGETTRLADRNRPQYGWVKGQHVLYVSGHHHRKLREPIWDDDRKCFQIPLTKGFIALVDLEDRDRVTRFAWHAVNPGRHAHYAQTGSSRNPADRLLMHRLIMGLEMGDRRQVDHIDGDGLNNRRSNLRICNQSLNNANRKVLPENSTSGFRGVSWHKQTGKWRAHIQVGGKQRHLGLFMNEVDAAKAYDEAAIGAFGEFASTNFPTQVTLEVLE